MCMIYFNKFKFLNKDNECALNALFVIIRKAPFCSFIGGYRVLWEAAPPFMCSTAYGFGSKHDILLALFFD